mgnify:CR=1 FL=1
MWHGRIGSYPPTAAVGPARQVRITPNEAIWYPQQVRALLHTCDTGYVTLDYRRATVQPIPLGQTRIIQAAKLLFGVYRRTRQSSNGKRRRNVRIYVRPFR